MDVSVERASTRNAQGPTTDDSPPNGNGNGRGAAHRLVKLLEATHAE